MNPLFKIFPHADVKLFESMLNYWKGDLNLALWSYGEIRVNEYLVEKVELKKYYKVVV